MTVLDIHFRSGEARRLKNVDYCSIVDGIMCGFNFDRRLIVRLAMADIDWIEVREAPLPDCHPVLPLCHPERSEGSTRSEEKVIASVNANLNREAAGERFWEKF